MQVRRRLIVYEFRNPPLLFLIKKTKKTVRSFLAVARSRMLFQLRALREPFETQSFTAQRFTRYNNNNNNMCRTTGVCRCFCFCYCFYHFFFFFFDIRRKNIPTHRLQTTRILYVQTLNSILDGPFSETQSHSFPFFSKPNKDV